MKKRFLILCAMAVLLAGCGEAKSNPSVVTPTDGIATPTDGTAQEYQWTDCVTLGKYKNLMVEVDPVSVTDTDVDAWCENYALELQKYVTLDKTVVEDGDLVSVAVTVLNGSEEMSELAYTGLLQLGEDNYFPELEEKFIGLPVGKESVFDFEMPIDWEDDLGVKNVTVKVAVNSVGEYDIPEITDEWVASLGEFDSVATWKDSVRTQLIEEAKAAQLKEAQAKVQQMVLDGATIISLPEDLFEERVKEFETEDRELAESYGLTFDEFLEKYYEYDNFTEYHKDLAEYVRESMKSEFVLQGISETEGLVFDEETYQEFMAKNIPAYGFTTEAELIECFGEEIVERAYKNTVIWDCVYDTMIVQEKTK